MNSIFRIARLAIKKAQQSVENSPAKTYTVVPGDNLTAIAKKLLGNASYWSAIYNANKDKISNPNLIQPGWVLKIPTLSQMELDTPQMSQELPGSTSPFGAERTAKPSSIKSLDDLEQYAQSFMGTQYKSPGTNQSGLDCSDFMSRVLSAAGVFSGRGSAEGIYNACKSKWKQLASPQRGAVIFYFPNHPMPASANGGKWPAGLVITHIALAINNSQVIDSSPSRAGGAQPGVGIRPYTRGDFHYAILMPDYPFEVKDTKNTLS